MATFRNRLPSNHDIHLLFAACVLLVHAWAIFSLLREVPSLILHMTLWELLGAAAYTLVYALLESLILLVTVTGIAILLPARWMRDEFAVRGTGVLYISLPCMFFVLIADTRSYYLYLLPLAACLLSLRLFYILLRDFARITACFKALLDRLSILSYLYLTMDALAVLIVVARNI